MSRYPNLMSHEEEPQPWHFIPLLRLSLMAWIEHRSPAPLVSGQFQKRRAAVFGQKPGPAWSARDQCWRGMRSLVCVAAFDG